ncbi:uncharacterized protein FIBRA_06923 [Fibroporia radiculosa]|uniref:Uncharacterized protein n=1 Tax=Fibroporia radiculosa TaxID=599839 RepID=J4GTW1_9APHY|nr:uncharacterized protein FIBRA_06923 [Fibroporia radiculosa]CCM04735.1 predicted protein [Fibroporia radiculosa]
MAIFDSNGAQPTGQGLVQSENPTFPSRSAVVSTDSPPSTPPRGRPSSRYPTSLARDPGRVPLHRRGTSKTYERLEDLLREAGYKETRIFTPEAERRETQLDECRKSSMREGVDSVMGYLASWMPGAGRSEHFPNPRTGPQAQLSPPGDDTLFWSLPPSPLSHKRHLNRPARTPSPLSPSASSATIASLQSHLTSSSDGRTVSYRHSARQPYPHSLRPQASASGNLRTYAQVSAAQGYLRHMASAPNMAKRRPSTRDSSALRTDAQWSNGQTPVPALPARWLESVTKAVAGSGLPGAHIGQPQRPNSLRRYPSSRALHTRDSRFTLSGEPTRPNHGVIQRTSGAPLTLTSCLVRAEVAPGAVSTARVVCRSAPTSRSSSRVGHRAAYGHVKPASRKAQRRSGGVPSLASTCVENDTWHTHWVNGQRVPVPPSGRDDEQAEDEYEDDEDDDDNDGELDFARLLVPPKRQYSIQSLRRHLHQSRNPVLSEAWDDDNGFGSRGHSRRCSMDEGDSHGWEAMGIPGFRSAPAKRRRGIPGGWSNITTRS